MVCDNWASGNISRGWAGLQWLLPLVPAFFKMAASSLERVLIFVPASKSWYCLGGVQKIQSVSAYVSKSHAHVFAVVSKTCTSLFSEELCQTRLGHPCSFRHIQHLLFIWPEFRGLLSLTLQRRKALNDTHRYCSAHVSLKVLKHREQICKANNLLDFKTYWSQRDHTHQGRMFMQQKSDEYLFAPVSKC